MYQGIWCNLKCHTYQKVSALLHPICFVLLFQEKNVREFEIVSIPNICLDNDDENEEVTQYEK